MTTIPDCMDPDEMERKSKRCIDETEHMFSPVINAMYIKAKGIQKARTIVRQVSTTLHTINPCFLFELNNLKVPKCHSTIVM